MPTPYATIINAFLFRVTEHKLLVLAESERDEILIGHMKAVCSECRTLVQKVSGVDLSDRDEELAQFNEELPEEVADIIAEGMVVRWLKPYAYSSENLENTLNTKEITLFSPANLLREIAAAYRMCRQDYKQMRIAYSYQNGKPEELSD